MDSIGRRLRVLQLRATRVPEITTDTNRRFSAVLGHPPAPPKTNGDQHDPHLVKDVLVAADFLGCAARDSNPEPAG
jgi:hypothetical protein